MHQAQWSPERPLPPPVSLASQSHHEKPPEVTCTRRGKPGFPASTRERRRPSSQRHSLGSPAPERELRGGRGDAALTSAAGSGPHAGEACTGKAALWAEVQAATALSSAHTPAHRRRASLQPVTILHPGILSGSIRESLILTAARSHLEEEQARQ